MSTASSEPAAVHKLHSGISRLSRHFERLEPKLTIKTTLWSIERQI
jgi:hypothetical protein